MKKYVFDSYAILAYLEKERNWDKVSDILKKSIDGEAEIFMSVINWGEVYYITLREGDKKKADLYKDIIDKYPIKIVNADKELTMIAAKYKAFYKMSYADAFAAGLAEEKKAILVTGDKEFQQIKQNIKIIFLF